MKFMNNDLYSICGDLIKNGNSRIIQDIKILLYKRNENIFDILDFENDSIYTNPILNAYFSNIRDNKTKLESIIYNYSKQSLIFDVASDEYGRIYLPNNGWLLTNYKNTNFKFNNDNCKLYLENILIDFVFEEFQIIENTNIEVLKYDIPLLKSNYINVDKEIIQVEIEEITKKHTNNLTKAYSLIKKHIPTQYELIENYAPKCVVFNVDTYQRNSFATFVAHGIAFYNAYQTDYDEVFFVDDIAHQTGHIIMNTLLYRREEEFFKIDKNTVLEIINMPDGTFVENRDLYVIFHALYTYYTSLLCLNACLEKNAFDDKQEHEAKGRIAFYINKCYRDLLLIDNEINSNDNAKEYFTDNGYEIYYTIKELWKTMFKKWYPEVGEFDMKNQPYNFTYAKFLESNPLINA